MKMQFGFSQQSLSKYLYVLFVVFYPLFLFQAWIIQYFNSGSPFNYVSRITFAIVDPPWLPPNIILNPLLGSHFFGDLLLGFGYSMSLNPYDPALVLPSQTLPVGLLFFKFMGIFGQDYLLLIYLILNLISIIWIIKTLLHTNQLIGYHGILILLCITSLPVLFAIDRGAVHLITLALLLKNLQKFLELKYMQSVLLCLVVISIKPNFLFGIILFLILMRKLSYIFVVFLSTAIINFLVLVFMFSGSVLDQINGFLKATSLYAGERGISWIQDSVSIVGLMNKSIGFFWGNEVAFNFILKYSSYLWIPGIIYFLIIILIIKYHNCDNWLKVGLILSALSMILPASMTYTLVWTFPAILIISGNGYLSKLLQTSDSNSCSVGDKANLAENFTEIAKVLYVTGLFFSTVFHIWSIKGPSGYETFPIGESLGPILVIASACLLTFSTLISTVQKLSYTKNLRKKYIQDSNNLSYSGSTNLTISEMGLKKYNNYIVKKINEYPHTSATRFLEFGAGRGTLTDIFSNVLNVKIDTVEIDPALVQILQKKGYRVYQDLTELKSEYDFIYTSNVLEHIVEDEHTLNNMLKVLNRKIGVFVIHVPAFPILYSNLDLSLGHVRRYTRKELKLKLENAGWNVVDIYFDDSLGFFVSFLLKFFGLSRDAGEVKVSSLVIYDRVIFPLSRIIDKIGVKHFFGKNLIAVAYPRSRKEDI